MSVVNNFQKSEYYLMISKFLPSKLLEIFSSKTFNSRVAHYLGVRTQAFSRKNSEDKGRLIGFTD